MDALRAEHVSKRRAFVVALCLGALLAAAFWGLGRQEGSAAGPRLVLTAPEEALAGEPIDIQLTIEDANGIAAFEVMVAFDTSVAHIQGFNPRDNDLAALGLDIGSLGPVEIDGGVAVGTYACPVENCADAFGKPRMVESGTGAFRLATLTLAAEQAGPLTIDLSSARFTDGEGQPIEVDLSAAAVTVLIVENGEGE